MKRLLIGIFCAAMMCSCADKEEDMTGGDTPYADTIGLSTKEISATAAESTYEVTTKNGDWAMRLLNDSEEGLYYDYKKVVTTSGVIGEEQKTTIKIEYDWFVITRELKKITIELKENRTYEKRVVKIRVNDRNYYDLITVEQAVSTTQPS